MNRTVTAKELLTAAVIGSIFGVLGYFFTRKLY
jgi:hypothetical protein